MSQLDDIKSQLVRIESKLDTFADAITRHEASLKFMEGSVKFILLLIISAVAGVVIRLY